ncbi:MAG: glycosyltransferase [Lachnospiraceae bacterium]
MSKIKVSIIIPIYNAENYLRKTLNDIISQSLKEIEIICVDDGSTDNSRKIIKEYQKKDSRIQLICQKNQYAGVARNNGFLHARGEYILFWDADDRFKKQAAQKMYFQAKKVDADICVCNAQQFDSENRIFSTDVYLRKNMLPNANVFNKYDIPEYIFNWTTNVPWNKMYKKTFIQQYGLKFQNLRQANDTYFTIMAFFLAEKITYVDEVLISYRINNKESLTGRASEANLCAYQSYMDTFEELRNYEEYELVKKSFLNRTVNGFLHALDIQRCFQSYEQMFQKIKSEGIKILQINEMPEEDFHYAVQCQDIKNMMENSAQDFLLLKANSRKLEMEQIVRKFHSLKIYKLRHTLLGLLSKIKRKSHKKN